MHQGITQQPKLEADVLATPKYKNFVKLEAGNDNLIHTNDQRMKPKENQKIFDQILKSLETPRVKGGRSQSKLKDFGSNFGLASNKENFNFSNFGKNSNPQNFNIQGSQKTKFSAYAGRYSVSGSRAGSPGRRIPVGNSRVNFANLASMQKNSQRSHQRNMAGLKTPQLRDQAPRFEQMMMSKGGDMDMITSAMPDRRSKQMFNDQMTSGLKGTVMPKLEASATRRRSNIPGFGFEEAQDFSSNGFGFNDHQNFSSNSNMQNLWKNEENSYSNQMNNFSSESRNQNMNTGFSNYLGKKRSRPEQMNNFGLRSNQFSGLRSKVDNYQIAMKPRNSQRRSGIRSVAPERFQESPFPKFKNELTYSTMKSLKTPDLNEYENQRRRLREKYEMESKMLMERIRNKAKKSRQEYSNKSHNHSHVQGGFKKPNSRKNKRGAARPPVIKEGDWLCPNQSCCNINWSKRSSCNL